jgi:hypothetical protein
MPALQTSWNLQFKIANNIATDYDSGVQQGVLPDFTQATEEDIIIASGTTNEQLPTPIGNLCAIYLLSDQAITVSLVPQGATLSQVVPLTLYPNMPTLLSAQFIQAVYVSNPTGIQANLSYIAAGK